MPSAPREPASALRPRRNFTRQEYDKMVDAGILGEDEPIELINGSIVTMSPEGASHSGTIDLAAEVLRRAFGARYTVRVQHPIVIDPDGEPEPDLAVVRGGPREHLAQHPRDPVLVIEVADSSLAYDRGDKALLYARAGFADYWIINLAARCLEVHREPSAGGYRSVVSYGPGVLLAPPALPGTAIPVADLLP